MIYNTIQRKVILDFLNNNKDKQFTVEEISEKIREVYNGVDEIPGKSTVYRIISKLVDEGEVKRFVKGKSRQFLYHISGCENQVTHLHFGGIYLDVKDGKVMVLANGEGTASEMTYVEYENAIWIVHSDTSHAGRMLYNFKKYKGANNIIDEFDLKAEYYDKVDDIYDETSSFTYRDQKITMEKFEKLRSEILGIE